MIGAGLPEGIFAYKNPNFGMYVMESLWTAIWDI
jgi:hypothetical protein